MSISQQFVVYGSYVEKDQTEPKGIVITLDFKELHEPQCKGVDNPDTPESDYELWTPYDGRHGENKCFMGQQISYIRRKQDSECFNGEEHETKILRQFCPCTEIDYECDVGYYRSETGQCVIDPKVERPASGLDED